MLLLLKNRDDFPFKFTPAQPRFWGSSLARVIGSNKGRVFAVGGCKVRLDRHVTNKGKKWKLTVVEGSLPPKEKKKSSLPPSAANPLEGAQDRLILLNQKRIAELEGKDDDESVKSRQYHQSQLVALAEGYIKPRTS